MPYHARVSRNTANNLVARAVAQRAFHNALVDQKLRLYFFDEGAPCADFCEGVGSTLAVIGYASELDPNIGPDEPLVRVLKGGLSALKSMMVTDKWEKSNTVSVDVAMSAAEELNKRLGTKYVTRAWNELNRSST